MFSHEHSPVLEPEGELLSRRKLKGGGGGRIRRGTLDKSILGMSGTALSPVGLSSGLALFYS